ncbi:hypothetical protein E4T44_08236 [Aureobasidium sp. EXF-8845]|nr:hypothetical protein E4T44_08236 [Aureobasidium sp. EXF-8845]KAI4847181.1 hypothetical protein E4T45_06896 [Aureobasidium sp. EXF-8846]
MSDQSMIPQRAPPPGMTSNLINPVSTGYQQTTCNILCLVFVTLFVTARIYTRIRLVKCVSWDDYLIILATLVFYSDVGCFQYIVAVGLGRHLWDVSAERFSPYFLETWTFAAMIYSVCMLLTKMSILMLYRRLFPIENFRYLWWMCVFCTVGYGLGAIFSSLFACVPVRAQWDLTVPTSRCINKQAFYIGNGVMNIITDLMVLALPIPIVWRLTLELRQKIILSVVFTLGSISCVISLVRLLSIVTWIRVGDSDITYTLQPIVAWSEIELAACILCACIPCLRPFFTTHLPFLSLSAHTSASSNDKTNPAGGNNNFPTTIGGKRSRAISPYPYDDTEGIFDGTQDIELENYDVEMQKNISSMPATPSTPYTPNTPYTATHAKKLSYAKHGYKPSTGNITVVSVQAMGSRSASRSVSRKSSFSRSSFEENGAGKSISRQQSLRSIGEERRGRSQRGRGNEDEGGIVVQTSYHVQTVREDV